MPFEFASQVIAPKVILEVHLSAAGQTVSSAGSFVKINFDTVDYDPLGNWQAASFRYNLPYVGQYLFNFRIDLNANAGGGRVLTTILTGTTVTSEFRRGVDLAYAAGTTEGVSGSFVGRFTALGTGSVVQLATFIGNQPVVLNGDANGILTYMQITYLGI